jgi:site-specific recombinase XerD
LTYYNGQANRITSGNIEKMVVKYSEAFGKRLTPHKLRHTLAFELYEETKDKVLVSQQLGQRGTSATDLYTHIDQTKQKNALNNIK